VRQQHRQPRPVEAPLGIGRELLERQYLHVVVAYQAHHRVRVGAAHEQVRAQYP
jgi:hypothetical protein